MKVSVGGIRLYLAFVHAGVLRLGELDLQRPVVCDPGVQHLEPVVRHERRPPRRQYPQVALPYPGYLRKQQQTRQARL